ncbi:MAG: protein kinase family protein [Phycisphaerales bacterium]|nr:protein kinase family protein [Phycisphaerales bacterium]
MARPNHQSYFGPYRLVRPQTPVLGLDRWVVLDEHNNTNHVLYRFAPAHDIAERRRLFGAMHSLSRVNHPHLLKLESLSFDDHNRLCVITPYTGNQDGLVTLKELLAKRDGKLGSVEAIRCLAHLLEASQSGTDASIHHGAINTDEILVDRSGRVQIELYGMSNAMRHQEVSADRIADEVRSIVRIGYIMLVGLEPDADRVAPSRLVRKLDRLWDRWFAIGLDPVDGFVDAAQALRALPIHDNATEALAQHPTLRPQVHLGSMLRRRFRTAGTKARTE